MSSRADHLIERAAARLAASKAAEAEAPSQVASGSTDVPEDSEWREERRDAIAPPGAEAAAPSDPPSPVLVAPAPAGLPALPVEPPELDLATLERAGLVVGRATRTRISEEFRIAVGRIAAATEQANAAGPRNPLILVTSAKPGEGKTFTALNLAGVLAQNGPRRVVLADIDFKHESLTDLLELGGRRGLYDVLAPETADPATLLVTTEVPRLRVMPAGAFRQDDLATSFTRPLGPRIRALAEAFPDHIVVMDAPPCLSTSDPSTLAELAGQVVLVVEAGRTQRAEVEAALDFVRACPSVTVLLNKVRQASRQTFGSYDYLSSYQ